MDSIEINNLNELPFGENITQKAYIAKMEEAIDYEILTENSIEYLDYLNFSRVLEILGEFFDVNAVAVAKENQLCAVALGSSNETAYEKIIENEPLAIMGSTVGFSKEINIEIAKKLNAMNVRNILAPNISKEALDYLLKNSNINILKIKSPMQELLGLNYKDIKTIPFGNLIQEQNFSKLTKNSFKVAGKHKPTQQLAEDAIFAWKVAKYLKSKAVVIAKDLSTKSIIQSNINPVLAIETAMDYACENSKDAVLALDGAMESIEAVNVAIQGRIGLIIESGDGNNASAVAKHIEKYSIVHIVTGIRNNRY